MADVYYEQLGLPRSSGWEYLTVDANSSKDIMQWMNGSESMDRI